MRLLVLTCGVLLGSLLFAFLVPGDPAVEAGTAVRMDVSELTQHADLIVEARVLSAQAFEEPDGRIETEYILDIDRTFQGVDVPVRSIRLPGGLLPTGRGMLLAGMPHIRPGETLLLFLSSPGPSGVRMPIGLAQGKFSVVEPPGAEKVLVRESAGLGLLHPLSGRLSHADGVSVLPYAEVVAQIEASRTKGQGR